MMMLPFMQAFPVHETVIHEENIVRTPSFR